MGIYIWSALTVLDRCNFLRSDGLSETLNQLVHRLHPTVMRHTSAIVWVWLLLGEELFGAM
jgi:hypothetical protein